jgi:hypothetical protein
VFDHSYHVLRELTRCTVEVGEVENISGTAHWVARAAETNLALLLDGSSEGRDGESEDGCVKHICGLGLVVVGVR